jgi:TM2 domain-containing membrane protein YozV
MSQSWYYAKNNERLGPVPLAELLALIAKGGLQPGDLVWSEHLPGWVPARKVRELFPPQTSDSVPGVRVPLQRVSSPKQRPPQPEDPANREAGQDQPQPSRGAAGGPDFDWNDLRPRHWIAGGGAFLAALGIAFTAIARSPVSLAFTLGGLTLAALGLYAEIGRLLGQALENIAEASRAAAERRHEAKKLAVEKQRLDLEAKRLAHEQAQLEQAGRHQTLAPQSPTAAEDDHDHDFPGPQAAPGRTIVINHPPIQRWSPGLAAVLSFFLPGLGQLYKGQILNGIVWFFTVGLGYMALILPGLLLHLFCIIGAASGNPWTEGKTTVVRE